MAWRGLIHHHNIEINFKINVSFETENHESVAGSVMLATETEEVDYGLRKRILQEDCW